MNGKWCGRWSTAVGNLEIVTRKTDSDWEPARCIISFNACNHSVVGTVIQFHRRENRGSERYETCLACKTKMMPNSQGYGADWDGGVQEKCHTNNRQWKVVIVAAIVIVKREVLLFHVLKILGMAIRERTDERGLAQACSRATRGQSTKISWLEGWKADQEKILCWTVWPGDPTDQWQGGRVWSLLH
jgi:hypothetical protein